MTFPWKQFYRRLACHECNSPEAVRELASNAPGSDLGTCGPHIRFDLAVAPFALDPEHHGGAAESHSSYLRSYIIRGINELDLLLG